MCLSLTYEPTKGQETHAELKLRRPRINRNIKSKQNANLHNVKISLLIQEIMIYNVTLQIVA